MTPNLAQILDEHVSYEMESIDRMYVNGYIPGLQSPAGVAYFLRQQRGAKFASSALLDPISRDFEKAIQLFIKHDDVPVHRFQKGERKDEETQKRLKTASTGKSVGNRGLREISKLMV